MNEVDRIVVEWLRAGFTENDCNDEPSRKRASATCRRAADLIESLASRLDDWHKVADERAAEIVRLQSRLDAALATIAEALRVARRGHSGPSGLCDVLHVLDGTCCFHDIPDDHLHNDCTCSMCRPRVVERRGTLGEADGLNLDNPFLRAALRRED